MTRHVIGQKCHVIGKRVYKHHVTIQLIRQQRSQRIKNIATYSKSTRRWQSKYFHQNKFLVFKCLFLNSPCSIEHHSYFILTQTWSSSCHNKFNISKCQGMSIFTSAVCTNCNDGVMGVTLLSVFIQSFNRRVLKWLVVPGQKFDPRSPWIYTRVRLCKCKKKFWRFLMFF